MSRYIDADDFFRTFEELNQEPYINFPTADVLEVIPCKNCFYAKPYNKKWQLPINENLLWCEHHNEEKEPNWFCADAIRREL